MTSQGTIKVNIEGVDILIQAEETPGVEKAGSKTNMLDKAADSFERAKTAIIKVSTDMAKSVMEVGEHLRPDEMTVKIGVKFDVSGNIIIANTSAGASLAVELKYLFKK
jgi:hypothetical protein